MNKKIIIWIMMLLTAVLITTAQGVPKLQGIDFDQFRNSTGSLLDGLHNITTTIYTSHTGGTAFYNKTFNNINFSSGNGGLMMDEINTTADGPFFLGISINGGSEISPRSNFTTVLTAIVAERVNENGTVHWDALSNYPGACPAGEFVRQIGDTLTCATPTDTDTDTHGNLNITNTTNPISIDLDTEVLTFLAGNGNVTIATSGNNVTIACLDTTNPDQNLFSTISSDGTTHTADSTTDTFTINNGSGISFIQGTDQITINLTDSSSQSSVDNSGRTYIQDVTLNEFGFVTGLVSATETVTDTTINNTRHANVTFTTIESDDWTNVTITESQITDLTHTTDTNDTAAVAANWTYLEHINNHTATVDTNFSSGGEVSSQNNITFVGNDHGTCYGGCGNASITWNGTHLRIKVN